MGLLSGGGKVEGGDGRYRTLVNREDVNMRALAKLLNEQADEGYRLHTAVEQATNLVFIFERE